MTVEEPPHPVLLNAWKHHARWIRWRVARVEAGGVAVVEELAREVAVIGRRLMDLYVGSLTPAEIGEHVVRWLRDAVRLEFEPLSRWLESRDGFSLVELPDRSRWAIRLGPASGRYVHLHPGRRAPHTLRVHANTLKSAVMAHALARATGDSPTDLAVVNAARQKYLGLLPLRGLTAESGLGAVVALLGGPAT